MPRSMATQHITLLYTKSFLPPRVSQMPSSLVCQLAHTKSTILRMCCQKLYEMGSAYLEDRNRRKIGTGGQGQ